MNQQEIFDRTARHLLKQGRKSLRQYDLGPVCRYRGPDGLMCAVGPLIPDEEYRPEMEGRTPYAVAGLLPLDSPTRELFEKDPNFLSELQRVHDHYGVEVWKDQLAKVADKHGLSKAVLEEFP